MKNSEIILTVNECLKGKKDSYNAIVRWFQKKIYSLCLSFLGTPQDAEDAAMDIFIKAYHSLPEFNPQYAFSTWLYKIAVNHSIGILRSQKNRKNTSPNNGNG